MKSKGNEIGAPDYSDSTVRMNMYAYVTPTNGYYTDAAGEEKFTCDHRSKETYQEYKDCGFDTLMLLGNDAYRGEAFDTSDLKKNLDLCQEVGLKCIVFDHRIHDYSAAKEDLIGEGKQFATMEEFATRIAQCMEPYKEHPAFYGLSLFDEPKYDQLKAMGQTICAIKAVKQDTFIHAVLLPMLDQMQRSWFTEETSGIATFDSYRTYIRTFLEESGQDYFGYDDYPIRQGGLLGSYFRCMQTAVSGAAMYGADTFLTIQSFGQRVNFKQPNESELLFQASAAMAFGVKNLLYFTYWMFPNRSHENFTGAIMDDLGNKMLYDEVQRLNLDIQKMAKVLLHFTYQKSHVSYNKEQSKEMPVYFESLESVELDDVKDVKVSQPTIMTQLYDEEKDITGYTVMNASVPEDAVSDEVSVTFKDYKFATIYHWGVPETVELSDGVLKLTIDCGDCVFVIPHN